MNGVNIVAQLMAVAATTAPKAAGQNYVEVKVLEGEVVQQLGQAMIAYGDRTDKKNFDRDGKNVLNSGAVVLIGLRSSPSLGLDCGACGFEDCTVLDAQEKVEVEFIGPTCAYRLLDMGIALGSAVKVASLLNVDNRIMYRIGAVARDMDLVDWDFVMGVPLSVTGKSIFFDR